MRLAGKIALVTGAGQGVGRGIALALAAAGARVTLFGRTAGKLNSVRESITAAGGEALVVAGDVCVAGDLQQAVATPEAAWGGLDILVNNAQQVPLGPLAEVSETAFERGLRSGPVAALNLMKLARPIMARRGGGTIVNLVSSAGVRWDMSGYGAYGAVKQAMRALTRAAAAEWGPEGIRVLSVAPLARSPGLEGWIAKNPDEADAFFRTVPLRRIGDCVEDIGQAVAALCGSDLSYLTGATIPLDGGQANFD